MRMGTSIPTIDTPILLHGMIDFMALCNLLAYVHHVRCGGFGNIIPVIYFFPGNDHGMPLHRLV